MESMKVLIADKFEKVGIDGLKELGCTVISQPDVKADELPALMRQSDPNILIVRGKKVSADALKAGTALTLVIRAGAGIDTIDVDTASSLGIFVSNCPGKNSIAVAELVMGLLLSCDRRIPDQVSDLRQGRWKRGSTPRREDSTGEGWASWGWGRSGRKSRVRAAAFGMRVIAWSRSLTHADADRAGGRLRADPARGGAALRRGHDQRGRQRRDEAPGGRRVPCRHAARARISSIPRAARWSTRRRCAGRSRRRASAPGLDVFQNEPAGGAGEFANPIVQAPGVYGTHHVGASTDQAQVAIAHEVIRIVQAFRDTGDVPNVVNRLARSSATHVLSIRHRNRPGVLAHVFAVLAGAAINVEEVENIIYHGAQATLARIHLDGQPNNGALDRIRTGNPDIISVELSEIMTRPHLQFQRRPRGPSRAGAPEGAGGHLERRRQRYRHHGAQPPRQGLRPDHRRGRGGVPGAGGHSGQLSRAVPAGRRLAPVLDGADEPAAGATAPPTTCSRASGRRRR